MGTYVNLLEADEVSAIKDKVFELRSKWVERQDPFFYTIGAANWLDVNAGGSMSKYRSVMELCNPILLREFRWLYERLLPFLASHLNEPVQITSSLGLPGFHIFLSHPQLVGSEKDMLMQEWYIAKLINPKLASSPIHYDDFGRFTSNTGKATLSFTLPISLPSSQSGINVWEVSRRDTAGLSINKERAAVLSSPKTFYPYSLGQLFIHDGDLYHQPVFMSSYIEGESRITLQGHAVLQDGVWNVYW